MISEAEKHSMAVALHLHLLNCRVCSAGDEGCSLAASMESICIDAMDFDPYMPPPYDGVRGSAERGDPTDD